MKNFLRLCLPALFLLVAFAANAQSGKKPSVSMNHVAIYVVDLQKSTHFYRDLIGLDTMPEPFHDGKHTWFKVGENCHVHVISGAKEATIHDKNAHICFSVASVDEFLKRLQNENIDFESWTGEHGKYTVRVDSVKQLYLKDPDGYWVEINDARY